MNVSSKLFSSEHLLDQLVDELLSVSEGSVSLVEGVSLLLESTEWGAELEWPQEVVSFLELWSAGNDLMDEVLNAGNSMLSEGLGDDGVISEGKSGSVDLSVSSFVNKILDSSSGWVTIGNEWLDDSNHVPGGLVELNEDSIVELSQSKEL